MRRMARTVLEHGKMTMRIVVVISSCVVCMKRRCARCRWFITRVRSATSGTRSIVMHMFCVMLIWSEPLPMAGACLRRTSICIASSIHGASQRVCLGSWICFWSSFVARLSPASDTIYGGLSRCILYPHGGGTWWRWVVCDLGWVVFSSHQDWIVFGPKWMMSVCWRVWYLWKTPDDCWKWPV
jgi:hypothetical protein